MLVNHERRLLCKAAASANSLISVKKNTDTSWPSDHSRLCALASRGELRWIGENARAHFGGVVATWQITEESLARRGAFEGTKRTVAGMAHLPREQHTCGAAM